MKTKPLVLTALFVAIYFVLNSFAIIFRMPQGGSATVCSTLFLVLPGFIYGKKYGVLSCLVASFISFVMSPWFLSPMQFLLDYTFASLAWSFGCFVFSYDSKYAIEKYYLIGMIFSVVFATMSGTIFFREYTPAGWNPFVYSVLYNSAYRFAEGLIVIIVLRIPSFRNAIIKFSSSERSASTI